MSESKTHSNTEKKLKRNTSGLKPFGPGADPRRNLNGRPRSFDVLRELGLKIANETVSVATKKLGAETPKPELAKLKVAEYLLRKWAFSNDPKLQMAFAEVAYGKVPDELNLQLPQNKAVTIKFDSE